MDNKYLLNPKFTDLPVRHSAADRVYVCLDLETTSLRPHNGDIILIALRFVTEEGSSDTFLIIPDLYPKEDIVKLFTLLANPVDGCRYTFIGHNIKFDIGFIYARYGVLLTDVADTMIMSQLINGGLRQKSHDLYSCLERYLNVKADFNKKAIQRSFKDSRHLTPMQLGYAAKDVLHLYDLYRTLLHHIEQAGLDKVLKLEFKLIPVLAKIEVKGCLIDKDSWLQTIEEWEQAKKSLIQQLDEEYMKHEKGVLFANINYSSSDQILNFFKRLKLPVPKRSDKARNPVTMSLETTDKESVDEGTLTNYLNEHPDTPLHHFIVLLIRYREYDKLLSTYGHSFLDYLDKHNYIHTTYSQCTTATGRLASSKPNLQNIPSARSGSGSVVRRYFIAPDGYRMITCDMSSAEVVLAADLSGDPLLRSGILEGKDIHSELASVTASIIYGKPVKISKDTTPLRITDNVTIIPNEFRDLHKNVTFSKFYKGGPARVYAIMSRYINQVHPPKKRMRIARHISDAIDYRLARLSAYLDDEIYRANTTRQLVITRLGRIRKFNTHVHGEAANAGIQGRNAEAMKIALVNTDKYLSESGDIGWIVLTVHDEIVVCVKEEYADEAADKIKQIMADALTYELKELKGSASVKVNKYWEK